MVSKNKGDGQLEKKGLAALVSNQHNQQT